MKIIIINGPNLNLLGKRDEKHYGQLSLSSIEELLNDEFRSDRFIFYHSNLEGEIINKIQEAENNFDGVIINPGGYAHTSVAIRDALNELKLPKIEVHLSHLGKREQYRQTLITAAACDGYISGFKENSYSAAVYLMKKMNNKKV